MNEKKEPVRTTNCLFDDNGKPHFRSSLSPQSVKVRAECKIPIHYPGIIFFVHGVNSTGEWFSSAEENICNGLNDRLGLNGTPYMLVPNKYTCDNAGDFDKYKRDRELLNSENANSPVVRFYWGYRAKDGNEDIYKIPLVNLNNEDYHHLRNQGADPEILCGKGPWFWGGGPFQNGTNNLVSLWGESGFNEKLRYVGAEVQTFAPDFDRLLKNAPPRKYYAHAAKRLSDLIDSIREKYPRDTISIISHSQGTMIALAATALAQKAPDSLFILNSPYAMNTKSSDYFSLPDQEILSDRAREKTLEAIIEKIAKRASFLPFDKYNELFVGQSDDNQPWTPAINHKSKIPLKTKTYVPDGLESSGANYPIVKPKLREDITTSERWISERDNHGRFYIYCNPHDRVMGSTPLLSLGWQGLPNNGLDQKPHKLLTKYKGHLFQRMMARSTSCGAEPNSKTPFWPLPDKKPFWDDGGDLLTYNTPDYQTLDINAEEVPNPIPASDMMQFDMTRPNGGERWDKKPKSFEGAGWGQSSMLKSGNMTPNDDTFNNFVVLYPKIQVPSGEYRQSGSEYPKAQPVMRLETDEERRIRVGAFISQPTDHSTLPNNPKFMRQVVAYDLPIGFCDATWDKEFMNKLRNIADWTKGYDVYFEKGELNIPPIPSEISNETMSDFKKTME
ncbi:T6SS effector phospholipase Tle3 domain-containing protein (plasmid) [Enterobacter ludwigii]